MAHFTPHTAKGVSGSAFGTADAAVVFAYLINTLSVSIGLFKLANHKVTLLSLHQSCLMHDSLVPLMLNKMFCINVIAPDVHLFLQDSTLDLLLRVCASLLLSCCVCVYSENSLIGGDWKLTSLYYSSPKLQRQSWSFQGQGVWTVWEPRLHLNKNVLLLQHRVKSPLSSSLLCLFIYPNGSWLVWFAECWLRSTWFFHNCSHKTIRP